ncbi:MAG: xanthine dehydrogenase family protein molybdopterin-binding subunit [Candidatus Korobacteraceae bacterium]
MSTSTPNIEEQKTKVEQGPIGKSVRRADGREKVRGEAIFYGDLSLPNMLHGRVKRSLYPHARILSIDTSRAKALPGVVVVATAEDIPGVRALGRMRDQSILCDDKVRYIGDGVALVAAETSDIAAHALELIDVQYEELPGVFSPKEAMLPGAPLVHESHESKDNILRHFKLRKGDADNAFKNCDIIIEDTYRTQTVEHAYLEVEGAVANKEADGSMTVWVGCQYVFKARDNVADMLNLPFERVRVINTNAGGGFGGKDDAGFDASCRAALLSHLAGRPVKLVYSRDESIISSTKRHASIIEYKTGATKDGRLQAVEVRVYLNKGAYSSVGLNMPPAGGLTNKTGYHAAGPYVIPNVKVDVFNVYTNCPAGGAFRGFGVPQATFAYESQIDELARRLGMDPVEIRLLNGLEAGSRTCSNQLLESSVGYKESIIQGAAAAGWKQFRADKAKHPATGKIRRGMGLGSFVFATSPGLWPEYGNAQMEIDRTGTIVVRAGIQELGQGSRTVLAQVAAQALGIPFEHFVMAKVGDTAVDQDSLHTVSSRGTIMGGNAIIRAAKEARQTLLEMAADLMDLPLEQVELSDGQFRQIGGSKVVPPKEVLLYSYRCGRKLIGKGWWCVPKIKIDPETAQGNPFHIYAYGAQFIEVEVNTETGEVKVIRVIAAQDVGKALNPELVRAQVQGGVVMGLGYSLLEEIVLKNGYVMNPSLAHFLIPTAADVPEIVPVVVEDPYPEGPFGAKGVGEPGMVATAAAIAAAVYDAVGVRIKQLPVTAERVWKALQEKAAEEKSMSAAGK